MHHLCLSLCINMHINCCICFSYYFFISGKCLLEDFLGKLLQVKIFCLVYFKLSLKSWNYLIFPLTRRRPLMTLGWTAIEKGSELKSKFSILTMLDYQSGKTQSLPFLNLRNIYSLEFVSPSLKYLIWTVMDEYLKEDDCKLKLHQYGCENDLCIWEITYFKTEVSQYIHIRWYLSANDATLPTPPHNPHT